MKFAIKLMMFLDHLLCARRDTLDPWYLLTFTAVWLSLSAVLISYFILWYKRSEKLNNFQICWAITWFYTHVLATNVYVFCYSLQLISHTHTTATMLGRGYLHRWSIAKSEKTNLSFKITKFTNLHWWV